ncbi:hypothetical protein DC31_01620 [Microbacterium sp. CH12i]|uniref:hypothetical protein n=1 Tax=Microbacterium sp. CH12i TaxID=1479651 RepID=UPI000462020A|nr:hypothetical protein [Microbacterium sp. CH12i]KDA07136.1 hypothetical protein DC31_01620 [Microbacterium sp. CH12i]
MKLPTALRSRRTLVALITASIAVILVTGVGVYGIIIGSRESAAPIGPSPSSTGPAAQPSRESPVQPSRIPTIPHSTVAETFARGVATALFTWDTGSGFLPLDYAEVILEVADPTGTEQPGLAADIATYMPTQDAWAQLRQCATSQRLEITSAHVPDTWANALAQARPGQLPAGAAAFTIAGIRHRSGLWNGDQVSAKQEFAFTVFIACPPDDSCYVLRLSQLNNPLR